MNRDLVLNTEESVCLEMRQHFQVILLEGIFSYKQIIRLIFTFLAVWSIRVEETKRTV